MADSETRERFRELEGAHASMLRQGQLPYPLDALIERFVFLEGIRMNYVGKLLGASLVFGTPTLLLAPAVRVGNFDATGPSSWELLPTAEIPFSIPWDFVHGLNAAPAAWVDKLGLV